MHTDSDSGENRYLAVPCSRNTGTNTMQMQSVARNVGHADFAGAVHDGLLQRLRRASTWRSMFSITTVPLSTRMPTASAKPPSVMVLSVCPPTYMHEHGGDDRQRDRGEDDERQPPVAEEQQDHQGGQAGRHQAAHLDAVERGLDEDRLVEERLDRDALRDDLLDVGQRVADAVDDRQRRHAAGLADGDQRAGRPSTETELVCTWKPSCTCATSRMNTVRPSTSLIGKALIASITSGLLFIVSV